MRFLSEEWLSAANETEAAERPGQGFDGTVVSTITGGPDGDQVVSITFARGVPVRIEAVDGGSAAVEVTLSYIDARAILAGVEDLNALFVSGRMKVGGGDTAPLVEVLKAFKQPAVRSVLAKLDALTD